MEILLIKGILTNRIRGDIEIALKVLVTKQIHFAKYLR